MKKLFIGFFVFAFLFISSSSFAGSKEETLFFDSIRKGHEGIVIHLLRKNIPGISVNSASEEGETPLTMAVREGHVRLIKILLKRGASIDTPDSRGETPLTWAVIFEKKNITTLLLENGADVNAPDLFGNTPIMKAVVRTNEPFVRILMDAGADPYLRNERGTNAIVIARRFEEYNILQLLLKKG